MDSTGSIYLRSSEREELLTLDLMSFNPRIAILTLPKAFVLPTLIFATIGSANSFSKHDYNSHNNDYITETNTKSNYEFIRIIKRCAAEDIMTCKLRKVKKKKVRRQMVYEIYT